MSLKTLLSKSPDVLIKNVSRSFSERDAGARFITLAEGKSHVKSSKNMPHAAILNVMLPLSAVESVSVSESVSGTSAVVGVRWTALNRLCGTRASFGLKCLSGGREAVIDGCFESSDDLYDVGFLINSFELNDLIISST